MTPVFQTIISPINGNCMQAAIASLFDKRLDEVPNFIEYENWIYKTLCYIRSMGYSFGYFNNKDNAEFLRVLEYDGGINGYFYAQIQSQTFPDSTHAVIIDKTGTVVHDPNPNGLCLCKTVESIIQIMTTKAFYVNNEGVIIDMDDDYTKEFNDYGLSDDFTDEEKSLVAVKNTISKRNQLK